MEAKGPNTSIKIVLTCKIYYFYLPGFSLDFLTCTKAPKSKIELLRELRLDLRYPAVKPQPGKQVTCIQAYCLTSYFSHYIAYFCVIL